MQKLTVKTDPQFISVLNNYPPEIQPKMERLRRLVLETAEETEEVIRLEETLKWGEPSFVSNAGSTIRMDYKSKFPDRYALYFQCTSRLVETFKFLFTPILRFEGKRAILFDLDQTLPEHELKACIKAALRYHKVKNLPTLGI